MCVFYSHPSFWTSSSLDVPAGVTQEEGHTGFLTHLPSAVRALIFVARRIQPMSRSTVGGGGDCHKIFPVLGGDGTIIAPIGDILDYPAGGMS